MKNLIELSIKKVNENPWHFHMMYQKDFDMMMKSIEIKGISSIPYPIIAQIDKKYYIVDGHSRIKAVQKAGFSTISCQLVDSITSFQDLRVYSFKMNKEGFSNPLLLSDMFSEDLKIEMDLELVASKYNVSKTYVSALMKTGTLNEDAKSIINKILETSKKKYHFILNQITPEHLAKISELPQEKQIQVIDWVFRDIMYGPTDESLVSIPSIYEIVEEIERVSDLKQKKSYKKRSAPSKKEFPLTCRCGLKFDIHAKSNTVYEFIEQNNVIIKKKFENDTTVSVFSSKDFSKNELINLIKSSKVDVNVVFPNGLNDEIRKE